MMAAQLGKCGKSSCIALYACSRQWASSRGFRPPCKYRTKSLFKSHSGQFPRWFVDNTSARTQRHFHSSSTLSAPKDPYKVLGVSKDSTPAEIKKVYFSLARKYHPDQNPDKGAREKFVEIQEAYDILKDEKKKAAYDTYGAASQQPGFDPNDLSKGFADAFAGFQGFRTAFGQSPSSGQGDFFDQIFGGLGAGMSGRASRGDDIEVQVSLSFLEACRGVTKTVNVSPLTNCTVCLGSGVRPGAKKSACGACGGTGTRTFVIDSGFQMASTCGSCEGSGYVVHRKDQCAACSGLGKVKVKKTVNVAIPPGAEDGMFMRVHAAGHEAPSAKGRAGDLLVRVNVAPSKIFRRQGANIYHAARIPLHKALLGGKARVPTLDGDVEVRVPAGIQHGEEMVLKNRGLPSIRGSQTGDLFISFDIQIPRSLTERQRELIEEYAKEVEEKSSGGARRSSSAASQTRSSSQEPRNDDGDKEADGTSGGDGEDRRRRATAEG